MTTSSTNPVTKFATALTPASAPEPNCALVTKSVAVAIHESMSSCVGANGSPCTHSMTEVMPLCAEA